MGRVQEILTFVILLFMVFSISALQTSAETDYEKNITDTVGEFIVTEEIPINDDLNFEVSNTCSGHTQFEQISARDDGAFVVYSLFIPYEKNANREDIYVKKYIDIYNSDGEFVKELSFFSRSNYSVEYTYESLNLYNTYSSMVYNTETDELKVYLMKKEDTGAYKTSNMISSICNKNKRRRFNCGTWEYICSKNLRGQRVKISRINMETNEKQTLVKMTGTNPQFVYTGIMIGVCGVGALVLGNVSNKKRNLKTENVGFEYWRRKTKKE